MADMITDDDIIALFRDGTLTLEQFGLLELEFRYYGESPARVSEEDESCDLLMVVIGRDGIRHAVPHCEYAEDVEDVPEGERIYEGIGGEFDVSGYRHTFSYISDESDTSRAFFDAVYAAIDARRAPNA